MNKEEIRESITIFDLCKRYGIKVKNNTICCPFHNDRHPSCSIFNGGKKFHCFSCGESGDVFNFVMKMEDVTFFEAFKMLGGNEVTPNSKNKLIKQGKLIKANEILLTLDIIFSEEHIRRLSRLLKKLEAKIYETYPNMKKRPCWTDYLTYSGNKQLKPIPALIAPYIYLQRLIDKCYESLDNTIADYKQLGYKLETGKEFDKVYPLICEYKVLCQDKNVATLENLEKVFLRHTKKRSDFLFYELRKEA